MKISNLLLVTLASTMIALSAFAAPTMEEFLSEINLKKQEAGKKSDTDDYSNSPLSGVLSREMYAQFKEDIKTKDNSTEIIEGQVITLNTKDREGCEAARIEFELGEDVCVYKSESPLVSVVVMKKLEDREYFEKKIDFSKLSQKEKTLLKSVADFGVIGAGALGLIYAMPESVSKWDKSIGFAGMAKKYKDRVKAGPVWDHDNPYYNYIGHPISGAAYYTMVRHQGFSALESATFSFFMSTFFWEYGIEAVAEIPSIQDLIITPLVGSIMGEVFYSWSNAIELNNGKVLGSKTLGKTVSVLLDPAGALGKQINKVAKYKLIRNSELVFTNKSPFANSLNPLGVENADPSYMGLQLKFKY